MNFLKAGIESTGYIFQCCGADSSTTFVFVPFFGFIRSEIGIPSTFAVFMAVIASIHAFWLFVRLARWGSDPKRRSTALASVAVLAGFSLNFVADVGQEGGSFLDDFKEWAWAELNDRVELAGVLTDETRRQGFSVWGGARENLGGDNVDKWTQPRSVPGLLSSEEAEVLSAAILSKRARLIQVGVPDSS